MGPGSGPTKDMVERSRSGAYIPVGMTHRSQLDATSPWSFAEKAKRLHAEDVCPDCAAESSTKLKETAKARNDVMDAASHFHGSAQPDLSHTPLNAVTSKPAMAIAADFINDTGAIVVVQHEGILDRIATDTRRGPLTRDSTQRLSENLVKVSKAVAQLGSVDEHPTTADPDTVPAQAVMPHLKVRPVLQIKSCSMSELLEDLHTIAAGMNLDISSASRNDATTQIAGDKGIPRTPFTAEDAEELLTGPSSPDPNGQPSSVSKKNEPQYSRGLTPGQSLLHGEGAESLLSDPTSPLPANNAALAAAMALRDQTQTSIDTSRSPSSTYATALSTRNNSTLGPISLPSSGLRAADYFPSTETPPAQRPASRLPSSPLARVTPFRAPGHYPSSPNLASPRAVQSPKPSKRVRVADKWPPGQQPLHEQQSQESEAEQAQPASRLQRAMREVAAKEKDLHRAVREAAEMERSLRRRVRTHGGLSGAYRGQ